MTPAEANAALNLPRIEGARSIVVGGKTLSVVWLRRLACQDTSAILPTPAASLARSKIATPPRPDPLIATVKQAVYTPIQVQPPGISQDSFRPNGPVTGRPDSEQVEHNILKERTDFEARTQIVKAPEFTKQDGEHMKSYLINYIDRAGKFHCEKIAAKGIVTAISIFYMQCAEKAIVSVICVL